MDPRFRKIAVFAGAAVLAGGAGVAVASQGGDETGSRAALTHAASGQGSQGTTVPDPSGGQSRGTAPGGPPGTGAGPGGPDLETLADALGVSTTDLQAALQDLQPQPPAQSGANPLVAALAGALDLPESKIAAALEFVRPSGAPGGGGTPPSGAAPPSGSDDGGTTTTETKLT